MKKIYSMKKVLLVVAALFACNTMFAQLTSIMAANIIVMYLANFFMMQK